MQFMSGGLRATGLSFARKVLLIFAALSLVYGCPASAQQFRAAWADVFHVGMQNASQVNTMVSQLAAGRYNAVIVQVQAYMDNTPSSHGAYWKSNILPRSAYVTASFDPLAYLCAQAHANGIEVHAWLGGSGGGMYRVCNVWPPAGNATLSTHPEWFMVPRTNSEAGAVTAFLDSGNDYYLLDMGSPDAQEYIISIVRELVSNYPIDGINWDDEVDGVEYSPEGLGFPAYSAAVYPHSGLARYRKNTGFVGTPSATDGAYNNYRRRFKNELIARCQAEIQSIKTNPRQPLRHTAAVMAYGGPPGSCGTFSSADAYTYYSDWATMLQNGWLDAAIPMNYKGNTNNGALYTNWCDRAYSCWEFNRDIFMGLGAYLNTRANTLAQLNHAFSGQPGGTGFNGAVTYSYGVPFAPTFDSGDWWSYVAANLYTTTAAVPPMAWRNPATATEGLMWGRVIDAKTGIYVDDATVSVTGGPTVKTDGNGYFVATMIPCTAGGTQHSAAASKSGQASHTISRAIVLAGDIVRYDFTLNIPALSVSLSPTNTAVVSWPSPYPGWTLEQLGDLATTNWTGATGSISDNGTTKSLVVNGPAGTRFFRLRSP